MLTVIPLQKGIHEHWIPVVTGMTGYVQRVLVTQKVLPGRGISQFQPGVWGRAGFRILVGAGCGGRELRGAVA